MSRLTFVVLKRDERAVLRQLGQAGVMQLAGAPAATGGRGAETARCEQMMARLEKLRRSLPCPPDHALLPFAEISLERAEELLGATEEKLRGLLECRGQLQRELAELTADAERVSAYCGLGLPLDRPSAPEFFHFITGTLPASSLIHLNLAGGAAVLPLSERAGRICLVVLTTRDRRTDTDRALRRAGFEPETLPAIPGVTADEHCEGNRRRRGEVAAELEMLAVRLRLLAEECLPVLGQIDKTAENEQRLAAAGQGFSRTEATTLITGWIPAADAPVWERRIRALTGGDCVFRVESAEAFPADEIPVLLRHPRWLRPFGSLVAAYGLPQYHELEPTLFVAVSFVLMFGMMFGDVGQGALLAGGGLVALQAGHRTGRRAAGGLLLAGGISSMVFGLLYGSCFGLPAFKRFALWQDPLAGNPWDLITFAVGAGVVMISLGVGLNIVNRFRHGDIIGGWLGHAGVAGLVFYWGALLLLAKSAAIQSLNLLGPAIVVLLVLPVAGWLVKSPLEFICDRRAGRSLEPGTGWFAIGAGSLIGVFEAMLGFLANTVSYVRLAAYALSHAALLLALFFLADLVWSLPAAGTFLGVVVVCLGNVIITVLEGVIASVQALRLEYYEFFSRFFSGAGRPFQPFHLQNTTVAGSPP